MDSMCYLFLAVAIIGLAAIAFALIVSLRIKRLSPGNEKMVEISSAIREGASAFLRSELKILAIFSAVMFVIVGLGLRNWYISISFIIGAAFSTIAGFIGMNVATRANVRTANAAKEHGMNKALSVAFSGGSVMGMAVVGFGLFGISMICFASYLLESSAIELDPTKLTDVLLGFSLGASSIALFSRVGGGIYTKAADVGADLVGKVENGIPEDDPRNPAVIADNVGDNVGDVAGMGADLFESYVGSIISAVTLATILSADKSSRFNDIFKEAFKGGAAFYPLALAGIGIIASILATFFVKSKKGSSNPYRALKIGTYVSSGIVVLGSAGLSYWVFGDFSSFFAVLAGLIVGIIIGKTTEIYTSEDYKSVKKIADQSLTGSATTVISGLAVGMKSTFAPLIIICAGILVSYSFGGLYGIALAAVGMLSTTGITVAVDSYGPIADNAGGIAQMAGLDDNVREITDKLDSVGNTTAAIGKGFAIGSAALTALSLFASYSESVGIELSIDILSPTVICGMLLGGMLPFIFSAFSLESVGKAANHMIEEVRRQFRTIPGIMDGTGKPDYKRCVEISTRAALKEMILPGIIAVVSPIVIGLLLGAEALGGLIAGSLITGVLLAIFMSTSGGAWDNAKKFIEEGHNEGKGSPAHSAAVVGDTIGDPFKDTAGPSINILIKLMTIISLVFAPIIANYGGIIHI